MNHPDLERLFSNYLNRPVSGLPRHAMPGEPRNEAIPHQAGSAVPIDPRQAWDAALAPLRVLTGCKDSISPPSEWPALVGALDPIWAVPCAIGNYPQMVREAGPLLRARDLTSLHPSSGKPLDLVARMGNASGQVAGILALIEIGLLRLCRHFNEANSLKESLASRLPAKWRAAFANEEAALAWHQGETKQALALWRRQDESVPILFNQGMAALFLGQADDARLSLSRAVAGLPEADSWHHLGKLYLTLAEGAA